MNGRKTKQLRKVFLESFPDGTGSMWRKFKKCYKKVIGHK